MKILPRFRRNRLTQRTINAQKRATKVGAKGFFTRQTIVNLYVKQQGRCACCDELLHGSFEIDHIIPLSRGGSNFPENIQLLKPFCNRSKNSKTMSEFLGGGNE